MSRRRYLLLTIGLLAVIAGASGFVAYRAACDNPVAQTLEQHDAMAWLRADFHLTNEQYAAIKKLHESYSVVCERHCSDIMQAVRARNDLRARQADPAALAAAEKRVQELRQVCETAIATHVRQCAQLMSPESGERYLALVLPKIRDFDHRTSPDLRLNHHDH